MYGFGTDIALTFNYDLAVANQLSVPLSWLNNEFAPNVSGDGYLELLGIDRARREITEPEYEDLALGDYVVTGPSYGIKYEYELRLQQLSRAKFDRIEQFIASNKLVRLDDKILKLTEYGARTRAIAPGTAAPTLDNGFVSYYASFLVRLMPPERRVYRGDGKGELWLKAIEYGAPLSP